MLDLALVAVYHRDLARVREGVEFLTLLRIEHVVNPSLNVEVASWRSLTA
jgi:hypothetical protein